MIYYQNMIKLLVKCILIIVFLCTQAVYASSVKVNDIVFDSSDSVIFISTSNTSENTVKIKKGFLQNPDRMYFDIENAVLTRQQGSFDFTYGKLSNLKISQFSVNPNTVRVVMTYTSKLKPEDVKIMTVGGSIIIKLQNFKQTQDFLAPVYREVRSDTYDYFEKVKVNESVIVNSQQPQSDTVNNEGQIAPKNEPVRINKPLYESKLRSRYFISNAYCKNGALLLAGTGIYNFEKPFYLPPAAGSTLHRIVFDIPNAVTSTKIRNKVFQLNSIDSVKIGQFEPTKVRIVITSQNPEKYLAICGNDLQNILIAREDRIAGLNLFPNTSSLVSANLVSKTETQKNIDKFTLSFSDPIVYSIKRRNSSVDLILYNVFADNIAALEKKFQCGHIENVEVKKISAIGVKITIPLAQKTTLDCLENLNATKLVFTVKNPQKMPSAVVQTKSDFTGRIIVLDPGHGGYDPGAMKNNVMEKNMTISIAKLIEKNLKAQGATVIMTRNDDNFVSLEDRVILSNNKKPDIFVSVHINSSENTEAHGIETHYFKDDSLDLAKEIHKSMASEIEETDRGILKSRFYVIRHTNQPSVLLELGFISNDDERNLLLLPEQQEKFAKAITDGISNYFIKNKKTGTK